LNSRRRGWIIIAFDLLFVIGVYFLYTQFAVTPSENTVTVQDTLQYTVTVAPPSGDTIPIRLTVSNPGTESRTASLPEGLVLFLTTGRQTDGTDHFWAARPITAGSVTLGSGERRSWRYAPRFPVDRPSPLFVALYVDEDRQDKVRVPE
jgi:hypothetical protein